MLFTSGPDRAFERLMQEKPGFDHYDGGGADAPEDCGTCRFYGCARSLAQKRSGPLPGRFQSVDCMVSPSRDMSR